MKKIFLFAAAVCAALTVNAEVITTNVYENAFQTADETTMQGAVMGTPAVKFSTVQNPTAGTAAKVPFTNANALQIQNKKASGSTGQNIIVAPIDSFAAPFTGKLSEIQADSIIWTFCFRSNNSNASRGFDNAKNGTANVLVADSVDLLKANGYAVVLGSATGKSIKLVRFAGGLSANANITDILLTADVTLKKYWTIRVTYLPATNTWRLAWYEDLDAFVIPANVTSWTECGSAVDDTFTSKKMTHFGFLDNYSGNNDNIMYVNNYSVTAYTTSEPTGIQDTHAAKEIEKVMINGKMVIKRNGVSYSVLGAPER